VRHRKSFIELVSYQHLSQSAFNAEAIMPRNVILA
jgi:hypothetical protein